MPLTRDEDITELLEGAKTIALVGASDNPGRASFGVMKFLQDHGYRVIPVNPRITGEHVHGEFVWRELAQIGEPIDIVDIFRNSADAAASGRRSDRGRREGGVDAAWRDQRGGGGEGRGGRAQGRDGQVPEDRDRAARDSPDQADATIISGTSSVGLSMPRRMARSLAGSSVANIALRFDAMVISLTAGPISPSTIRKPAAPRE